MKLSNGSLVLIFEREKNPPYGKENPNTWAALQEERVRE